LGLIYSAAIGESIDEEKVVTVGRFLTFYATYTAALSITRI
jgi:hypothetical protein